MYGKHFASMYSGSLFGKPAIVFAVWGYVLAHMRPSRKDGECFVEINPALLGATFATTSDAVLEALEVLEAPDPVSRTKDDDGRRLVLLEESRHSGPMQFRVVNGRKYRAMRDEEERRIYLRDAKRAERSRVNNVNNVNRGQPPSTQVEVEVEVEESKAGAHSAPPPPMALVPPADFASAKATRTRKTKPPVDQASDAYRLASLFLQLVQQVDQHAVANLDQWARELAPMITTRGAREVEGLIRYARADERERKYTFTPKSLKANATRIVNAMSTTTTSKGGGVNEYFREAFGDR